MKCLIIKLCAFLLVTPTIALAGWEVAKPGTMPTPSQNEPFFQAGYKKINTPAPQTFSTKLSAPVAVKKPPTFTNLQKPQEVEVYAISVSGSLKENIERIMDRYHWKVVWKAPYDYNFDGRVTGSSLPNVMEKLLKPFPLQAQLFMSNRTMTIVPRKV